MSGPVAVVLAVGPAFKLEPELLQADSTAKHTKPMARRGGFQRSNVFSDAETAFGKRSSRAPRHRLL
jgi:hypothetical protein